MDKITRSQYERLKENYLCKNRSMYSLYSELNKENTISKHLFFQLINKIRREEGLGKYYKKSKKKKKSCIDNLDKSPNHYN